MVRNIYSIYRSRKLILVFCVSKRAKSGWQAPFSFRASILTSPISQTRGHRILEFYRTRRSTYQTRTMSTFILLSNDAYSFDLQVLYADLIMKNFRTSRYIPASACWEHMENGHIVLLYYWQKINVCCKISEQFLPSQSQLRTSEFLAESNVTSAQPRIHAQRPWKCCVPLLLYDLFLKANRKLFIQLNTMVFNLMRSPIKVLSV